jgi:hypothetical protein
MNANVASVYSAQCDGVHGLLALAITAAADYKARSVGNKEFTVHMLPPPVPTHMKGATDADITEGNRQHKVNLAEYAVYFKVDKALHPRIAFSNQTCYELLQYLNDEFGTITDLELEANANKMKTHWHPPMAVKELCL